MDQDFEHTHQGFDERAATWDATPEHVARAKAVAHSIIEAIPLDTSMRMLEYGAGTGLVTEALRERVGLVTLADTSAGMRDVIQAKIDAGALGDARVWDLDLATQSVSDEHFDLIVTAMTLHHIIDLPPVLARFNELLVPGGHLCVVDLDREDGSFHGEGFDGHHGFDRDELAAALKAAEFTDIAFGDCHEMVRDGVRYPIFFGIGRRPEVATDAH